MTRLLFFIIITLTLSCQSPSPKKEVVLKPSSISDESIIDLTHNDSINRQEIFNLYEKIKISKHWEKQNKSTDQIDLSISTAPEIDLLHDTGDSSVFYKVIDVTNHSDSISLKTTNYNGDITYIWTLKNITNDKGIWTLLNTQTKTYKVFGTYKSRPRN